VSETNAPIDPRVLFLLATSTPDPSKIDWRAEYAKLYGEAELLTAQLRDVQAEAAARAPFDDITDALSDMQEALGGKVELSCERDSYNTDTYRVWITRLSKFCGGNTVAEAVAKARAAVSEHQTLVARLNADRQATILAEQAAPGSTTDETTTAAAADTSGQAEEF
jgi:hypothetical protein